MLATTPCFTPRRNGLRPELVVLHYTAMAGAAAALERLCDPAHEVSAHYLISENGDVFQMVAEEMRAWHAGAGSWGGAGDVNSRSIGIELDNPGTRPFAEPQMQALQALLPGILNRWSIPPAGVIGHSDMAPGRKVDPGAHFDWPRLAAQGLAIWPEGGYDPGDFFNDANVFGYDLPQGDDAQEVLLAAFRLRFRPHHSGPLDDADRALMAELAARWPYGAAGGRDIDAAAPSA